MPNISRGKENQKMKSRQLTLSRRRPLSYRNQSIDLLRKSMDWFLYDNGLRLERVKRSDTSTVWLRYLVEIISTEPKLTTKVNGVNLFVTTFLFFFIFESFYNSLLWDIFFTNLLRTDGKPINISLTSFALISPL